MTATLVAFLRSSCRGLGLKPTYLDEPTAADDPLKALLQEAISLRQDKRSELSLELLEIARSAGLHSDWIEDNRARALIELGRIDEAETVLNRLAQSENPAVAQAALELVAGLNGAAAEAREEAQSESDMGVKPDVELTALLEQAIELRERGDAQASLDLLDEARGKGIASPWLEDNRARALADLGRRFEAEGLWRSLASDPDDAVAAMADEMADQVGRAVLEELLHAARATAAQHHWELRHLNEKIPNLAAVQESLLLEVIDSRNAGKAELSLSLVDHGQDLGFPSPWLQDNRARALVNLGRRLEAMELWEALAETGDQSLAAQASDLASHQRDRAIQEIQETLLRIAAEQGIQLERSRQTLSSIQMLQEAVLNDAIAAREQGYAAGSLRLLETALDYGMSSPWIEDNRARALIHLKRNAEAVAIWRDLQANQDRSVGQAAEEMLGLYARDADRERIREQADALIAANQPETAIQVLTEAILADPTWDGWRESLKRAVAIQQHESRTESVDALLESELRESRLTLQAFDAFLTAVEKEQGRVPLRGVNQEARLP